MTIQRMEDVGILVDDLSAATGFFAELGLVPNAEKDRFPLPRAYGAVKAPGAERARMGPTDRNAIRRPGLRANGSLGSQTPGIPQCAIRQGIPSIQSAPVVLRGNLGARPTVAGVHVFDPRKARRVLQRGSKFAELRGALIRVELDVREFGRNDDQPED